MRNNCNLGGIVYSLIKQVYIWKAQSIEHICDIESALDMVSNMEPDDVFDQSRPAADIILVAKISYIIYSTQQ
jgi:hypothetical protein